MTRKTGFYINVNTSISVSGKELTEFAVSKVRIKKYCKCLFFPDNKIL